MKVVARSPSLFILQPQLWCMVKDRITVSLDDDAKEALENLVSQTGKGNSELVRNALLFYVANQQIASSDISLDLEEYHKMLVSGEHALLDIDFVHTLLKYSPNEGEQAEAFTEDLNRVAEYHATEYAKRFDTLEEVLEWLSICGFLTVRESDANTYHVVFPTEDVKWFMLRFLQQSTSQLPFALEIEEGVSKALLRTVQE